MTAERVPHRFAGDAHSVMSAARLHALTRGEPRVTSEGLLVSLSLQSGTTATGILSALRLTPGQVRAWLDHTVGCPQRRQEFDYAAPYTDRMVATILAACAEASAWGTTQVSAAHLLIGILREPRAAAGATGAFLHARGFTLERLRHELKRATSG